MTPCAGPDPELLLRQLLACYSERPADDPRIIDAAAQIQAVAEYGWGQVTLEFSENQLRFVRPQPVLRFGVLRTMRET